MPDTLTLAAVQFTPAFGAIEHNLDAMMSLVESVEADVFIFPELCTTGYCFHDKTEARALAENVHDGSASKAAERFGALARAKNAVVIAGFAELANNSDNSPVYNSAMIIQPSGKMNVYRKTHLFYKERFVFDEGNTGFFVVEHETKKGVAIGTMICYDWRFPEAARSLALKGAHIIACPSNLITQVWNIAMPTRALENSVFLAVANRAGAEDRTGETVAFNGRSSIYGTRGETLAEANATDNTVILTTCDIAQAGDKSFNAINDIFLDRRPNLYDL